MCTFSVCQFGKMEVPFWLKEIDLDKNLNNCLFTFLNILLVFISKVVSLIVQFVALKDVCLIIFKEFQIRVFDTNNSVRVISSFSSNRFIFRLSCLSKVFSVINFQSTSKICFDSKRSFAYLLTLSGLCLGGCKKTKILQIPHTLQLFVFV